MMDDQNGQTPVQTDKEQTVPAASPTPAPESVEQEKTDGDEKAVV